MRLLKKNVLLRLLNSYLVDSPIFFNYITNLPAVFNSQLLSKFTLFFFYSFPIANLYKSTDVNGYSSNDSSAYDSSANDSSAYDSSANDSAANDSSAYDSAKSNTEYTGATFGETQSEWARNAEGHSNLDNYFKPKPRDPVEQWLEDINAAGAAGLGPESWGESDPESSEPGDIQTDQPMEDDSKAEEQSDSKAEEQSDDGNDGDFEPDSDSDSDFPDFFDLIVGISSES